VQSLVCMAGTVLSPFLTPFLGTVGR
jgi:hypothetical protein